MNERISVKQLLERYESMQDGVARSKGMILHYARKGDFKNVTKVSEELAEFESYISVFLNSYVEVLDVPFRIVNRT